MKKLISRLKEPSTYAGLAGLAVVFGISMGEFQNYANSAAGVFAFISIIVGEGDNA